MKKLLYSILLFFLLTSCKDKEVEFIDVDICFTISLTEDLNKISNIRTQFNKPLESGIVKETRSNKEYNIDINNVKCPTNIDLSVIFERNENVQIEGELPIKKTSSYKVVKNYSDGSSHISVGGFTASLPTIPSYNEERIIEFFKEEGVERLILNLDKDGI